MDADAEFDALTLRNRGIAFGHAALNLDGAAHGLDHARELGQQPVAGGLDDSSAMLLDLRVDQSTPMLVQPCQGAFLVGAHETAVTGDIGRQNGRQSPFYALGRQIRLSLVRFGHLFTRAYRRSFGLGTTQGLPQRLLTGRS